MGADQSSITEAHVKATRAEEIAKNAEERAKRAENDIKKMAEEKAKAQNALVAERKEIEKLRANQIESVEKTIRTRSRVKGVVTVAFYGNYY